uniref:Proteasome activator complex subunit 4 n=1 Tax=Cajanus cajan TaxID=3821 RepID=A0A151UAA0_CAJCA|nr:Proteasome activator complex subunit 4 [Cajanus cajan]
MHLYNAWLPPPVADQTAAERHSFARVIAAVNSAFRSDDPESVFSTLKFISVLDLFIKAKSDVSLEDVRNLIQMGLEIFHVSRNKLYAQVRWGNLLVRLLNKYRKKIALTIEWRPLYDTLVSTHFTRSTGPEGWRIRQRHFETITSLVQSCRRFFPSGSAFEICDWITECIDLWESIPSCQFWNNQWADVIARVVKNYHNVDWECFLPLLFARYLNMFEVPVANGSGSYPFSLDVPRNTRFLFSNKTSTPAKAIAKSIIYLLRPGSSSQQHFEKLINILEQYYHPSNGGRWTYSLERFLFHLVFQFQKRLQNEQLGASNSRPTEQHLGESERVFFVNSVLKLIDRGQYSKNEHLSETVAAATSILSYVEPSLVLPFVASRFRMALETLDYFVFLIKFILPSQMTATHQLKIAVMSVAFVGRSLFFTSVSASSMKPVDLGGDEAFIDLVGVSLSNALLGMDANDPPKTLATMQLIGSIFSNLALLDDKIDDLLFMPMIRFSEWLDEFLCRLFSLLLHLEPSSVINEGLHSSAATGTFLVDDGPYYFCVLEILFGRLSKSLYNQALKKISKFVRTNILPGAIAEVGLLCCACVHSNPEEAVSQLVEPILLSVISSLKGTPRTGFGGGGTFDASASSKVRSTISPALEAAIDYQLKILSVGITYGGPALLRYKDQFKEAIFLAFDSPSWKVNGAADHLLRSILGSQIHYYPIDQYRCVLSHPDAVALEEWISTKDFSTDERLIPKWHIPCDEEVHFANELLDIHFKSALDDLLKICQTKIHADQGDEKEHLKVTLLRIESSLQGLFSCLPDFVPDSRNGMVEDSNMFLIAGATGCTVGSTALREKATEIVHAACKYVLEKKSDDSILLILIIRIIDALGNYGSLEYDEWSSHRQAWKLESAAIIEPPINFIVSSHSKGKKRPRWALIDKAFMHNTWRSSQASYHLYRTSGNFCPCDHVTILMDDLLSLCLHSYETVRLLAGKALVKLIKRWPSMISKCVITLTNNLKDPNAKEYAVLGSCSVLASQTVLKHLTTDPKSFSSFILAILSSSHHESLKAQKAINELFVKYNIQFSGVSRSFFRISDKENHTGLEYNLMANRVLLLLALASRNHPNSSSKILSETAGHFLKNLKSQLPQTRILAISALNTLLKESPYKLSHGEKSTVLEDLQGHVKSSLEGTLTQTFQEEGFFNETLTSLSHVHIITDTESASRGSHGDSSFQSLADKSITRFYFEFSASWPRTPSWISFLGSDTFYSNFARIFKRLVQECGMPVVLALKITGKGKYGTRVPLLRQKILDSLMTPLPPTVATTVTAKRYTFLAAALIEISPQKMPVAEIQLHNTLLKEVLGNMCHSSAQVREALGVTLSVLCSNIRLYHSSHQDNAQGERNDNVDSLMKDESWVQFLTERAAEAVVNIQIATQSDKVVNPVDISSQNGHVDGDSEDDMKWMETLLHFIISSLKSGRSSYLLDVLVGLLYPVICLQETSNKDLSILAKAAFELLKWVIVWEPHLQKAVSVILSAANDSNWRTRSATLTYLRTFMYRHTFILSSSKKQEIWRTVEKLLVDNQIEASSFSKEHAAAVLAGLMKGGDEDLARDFRDRAYREANIVQKRRKLRNASSGSPIASVHGAVLALVACVLSAPYDMPSWLPDHVTLLACFSGEPAPVKSTVTKAVAEFRRTHADTWNVQKELFTEEQLEILADTSSSSSYFA